MFLSNDISSTFGFNYLFVGLFSSYCEEASDSGEKEGDPMSPWLTFRMGHIATNKRAAKGMSDLYSIFVQDCIKRTQKMVQARALQQRTLSE